MSIVTIIFILGCLMLIGLGVFLLIGLKNLLIFIWSILPFWITIPILLIAMGLIVVLFGVYLIYIVPIICIFSFFSYFAYAHYRRF